MKSSRNAINKQSKQGNSSKPRPEIRDNMDSRSTRQGNFKEKNPQNNKSRKSGS